LPLYKKLFGYFLILFSLLTILLIGFPQVFTGNNAGRINKEFIVKTNFLDNETSNVVLLYFGYVGCSTVCLPSLSEINTIYSQTVKNKNVRVYFVNLLTNTGTEAAQIFATQFNADFKGIQFDKNTLKKVTSEFDVVYSQSPFDDYELNHAGFLYLLEKDTLTNKYKQKYIYTTRPYNIEMIINDINKLNKQKD